MAVTTKSIFYTTINDSVKNILDIRSAHYASENRDSSAHAWLFKKIAWADAAARNEVRSAVLTVPTRGGLGRKTGSGTSGGMYKAYPSNDGSLKFFPKPHIDAVNVSAEGDFGSIIKLELKFTVHTLTDLDSVQAFFDIGGDLFVNWGWNQAGTAGGQNGRFEGKIYNFSYQLNSNGGFDCSTHAMMAGITILGGNVDAAKKIEKQINDDLGNAISADSIINAYKVEEIELSKTMPSEPVDGLMIVKYHKDWAEAQDSTTPTQSENKNTQAVNQGESESHLYVSLERFVKDINLLAQQNSDWFKNNANILCNEECTRGLVPINTEKLISANPTEVLFPGFATYGPNNAFSFGSYDDKMKDGDISKCMISYKWLRDAMAQVGTTPVKGTKSADSSVSGMLNKIFNLIYKHSGERFKLTIVADPVTTTGTQILVTDINYIDTSDIFVYEIPTVTQGSITRAVSMASKIPNEFQTAAFVTANSTFSNQSTSAGNGSMGRVLGRDPEKDSEVKQQTPEENIVKLADAKKLLDSTGVTPDNVKSMQVALKRERVGAPADFKTVNKEGIPFPLDLTITLDGVNGIIFGNTITCNYMPSVYKKAGTKIAFTVTKVSHSITGGDWTTTLNTVCRIISDTIEA